MRVSARELATVSGFLRVYQVLLKGLAGKVLGVAVREYL